MNAYVIPAILLTISNTFMTAAWYGHLRFRHTVLWKVILVSWGIAFFEYSLMIPANRIGYANGMTGYQLKIMQEAITLGIFVPFAILYMNQPVKLDYLWASLCIMGAVYFTFRG